MTKRFGKFLGVLATWAFLTGIGMAEIPAKILVMVEEGKVPSKRIELTGGLEAFLFSQWVFFYGTVQSVDGKLKLKFQGDQDDRVSFELVLSRSDKEWVDGDGNRWVPREQVLKTDPSWTPVKIRVRDQKEKGLGKFGYRYRIEWNGGNWDSLLVRWTEVEGEVFEILAPPECVISLELEHPDLVRGYGSGVDLDRKDGAGTLDAVARLGKVVKGKVVDDATGEPIEGAEVCPHVFTPPLFTRDWKRVVVTGADGRFMLRGVDGSFSAKHPDFLLNEVWIDEKDSGESHVLRLKAGSTIRGVVRSPEGKVLEGVIVTDGSGKVVVTDAKGVFELRGLQKWSGDDWWLDFSKDGFNDFHFQNKEIDFDGLEVELVPLPEFSGRVLLGDGSPAREFLIVCGPGSNPAGYQCVEATVSDKNGRFVIRPESLPEKGEEFWLGVRADGAAPWEGVVSMDQLSHGDFRVNLKEGAVLTAALSLPSGASGQVAVSVESINRRPSHEGHMVVSHAGKALAKYERALEPGELLRIPHLREGEYSLKIRCRGASPLRQVVKIGEENIDLGKLSLPGTGSISGVINEVNGSGAPWRFADGEIHVEGFGKEVFDSYLNFKADAEGRFRVDGVPIGLVLVSFRYLMSADIVSAVSRNVHVTEGQVTEVRFEGEGGSWAQELKLLFDGKEKMPLVKPVRAVRNVTDREPMFRFDVSPVGDEPVSWASSTERQENRAIGWSVPDLSPGRWKIRVYDWLGSRGFDEGLRSEVITDVGEKRDPIVIDLGACSLSGRVVSGRETRRHVRIVAVGAASGRVFLSRCDGKGNFVVRYLPEDNYFVHAHDDDGGWCDLGSYPLKQALVDCGEHQLEKGGHVAGILGSGLRGKISEEQLKVVGADNVEIPVDEIGEDGRYRFGNLRPGKWTVVISQEDHEVIRHGVEIREGMTVTIPVVKPGE